MTPPLLLQAFDRFISLAKERLVSGQAEPFRHHIFRDMQEFQTAVGDAPHRNRAVPSFDRATPQPSGETYVLSIDSVWITCVLSDTPFHFETDISPSHLSMRYVIRGANTYSTGNSVIASAPAGSYVFRFNRGPLVRVSTSENYRALVLSIPIPPERPFSSSPALDRQVKQYLDNGFIVIGQSKIWGVHLAYALNHILEGLIAGTDAAGTSQILGSFLYRLCCQELAERAGSRDPDQQHQAAPLKLRVAENFMIANAVRSPTVEEIAVEAGLSVRSLRELFAEFRGTSPVAFLREQRLAGIHAALCEAGEKATVPGIAAAWNYRNVRHLAAAYRKRFGETPAETLGRRSSAVNT